MTRYSASYVLSALTDNGWPEMSESDAIEILVSQGIKPSQLPLGLDALISRAKARMSKRRRIFITENHQEARA